MAGAELPSFHGLVGRSAAMQALFRRIEKFARRDLSILIQGETGTGKDKVATALHRLGPRRGRRLEVVNCATLTREMLLSELFGHERGAFTGAVTRKDGLLVLAHEGTVFLDEVGELPLEAQAMLLRFLETGEVRPVGSTRTLMVDVRVIAATNRNLEEAVKRREFREDLYHRLSDVVLEVPPLRERRDDISLLVEHFRILFNGKHGLAIEGLGPEALAAVMAEEWSGNVRALSRALKEAMVLREEGWIAREDLRVWGGGGLGGMAGSTGGAPQPAGLGGPRGPASPRRETALRIAREHGAVNRRQLAARCGVSGETARQELGILKELGLLRQVGRGSATRYVPA